MGHEGVGKDPLAYEYTYKQPTGSATLLAPSDPGNYEGRYISNEAIKAKTTVFKVVAAPKPCPNDCSNNGACDTGTGICDCDAGWTKEDCSERAPTEWAVAADAISISWVIGSESAGRGRLD